MILSPEWPGIGISKIDELLRFEEFMERNKIKARYIGGSMLVEGRVMVEAGEKFIICEDGSIFVQQK